MLFLLPAGSTTYWKNSIHFHGTLMWNQLPSSKNPVNGLLNFKSIKNNLGKLTVDVLYVENSFYLFVFSLMNVLIFVS